MIPEKQILGDLKNFGDEQLRNIRDYFFSLLLTDNNKDKNIATIVANGNYTLLKITVAYMELAAEVDRRCGAIKKQGE